MNPHVDYPIAPIPAVVFLLLACNGQLAVVDDLNTQGADLEGVSDPPSGTSSVGDPPSGTSSAGDPASPASSCGCAHSDSLQALGCGSGEVPLLDNDVVQSSRDGSVVAFDVSAAEGAWTVFHWNGSGPARPIADGLLIGSSASGDQLLVAAAAGVLRVSPIAAGSTPIVTPIAVDMVAGHGSLSAAGDRVVGVVYGQDSVQLARANAITGQVEVLGEIDGWIDRAYVNPDATAIVGFASSLDDRESLTTRAFRWDERGLRFGLPDLPDGLFAWPEAVSADGSVIAGRVESTTTHFLWSEPDRFIQLASASWRSETSISADGSVVLGSLDPDGVNDSSAFRWTAATGAVEIAPGEATVATDMSDDGNVVVATSWEDAQLESPAVFPRATYVWDSVHGTRSLTDILAARGADLGGWEFGHARVLSGNGKVLFGRALCGGVPALYRVVLSD